MSALAKDITPHIRGQLSENVPLGAQSWFKCGGSADLVFQPAHFEDLQNFLKHYPKDAPLMVLGGLANTIVRDGGIRGCVVMLGKAMADVELLVDQNRIIVGAGALNGTVAAFAAKNGLGGLEFFSGIPGSVGGATAMNAGAYGTEVKDVLVEAAVMDRDGVLHLLTPDDLKMTYRHTALPPGSIVIHAILQGQPEDHGAVRARLKEIKAKRSETQPIREQTGGSTFANPSDEMRAWQVVEKVGGRGLKIGGAMMSEMHCNFMVNDGMATAADLEALGDELIQRAKEQLGIDLRWEIKRVGDKL
ncbi:MAG: UDP-N-acetylmuramate dehydrogenase [Pseudomonadota bacterium]